MRAQRSNVGSRCSHPLCDQLYAVLTASSPRLQADAAAQMRELPRAHPGPTRGDFCNCLIPREARCRW